MLELEGIFDVEVLLRLRKFGPPYRARSTVTDGGSGKSAGCRGAAHTSGFSDHDTHGDGSAFSLPAAFHCPRCTSSRDKEAFGAGFRFPPELFEDEADDFEEDFDADFEEEAPPRRSSSSLTFDDLEGDDACAVLFPAAGEEDDDDAALDDCDFEVLLLLPDRL